MRRPAGAIAQVSIRLGCLFVHTLGDLVQKVAVKARQIRREQLLLDHSKRVLNASSIALMTAVVCQRVASRFREI